MTKGELRENSLLVIGYICGCSFETSYRQTSLALRRSHKLSLQFYGTYRVLERIGLPSGSKILPVFHVSIPKKQLGTTDKIDSPLPLVSETSCHLQPQPIAVLNSRSNRRKRELLIK